MNDLIVLSEEAHRVLTFFHRIPTRSVNGNIKGALRPYEELVKAGYIEEIEWPEGNLIEGWKHYKLVHEATP